MDHRDQIRSLAQCGWGLVSDTERKAPWSSVSDTECQEKHATAHVSLQLQNIAVKWVSRKNEETSLYVWSVKEIVWGNAFQTTGRQPFSRLSICSLHFSRERCSKCSIYSLQGIPEWSVTYPIVKWVKFFFLIPSLALPRSCWQRYLKDLGNIWKRISWQFTFEEMVNRFKFLHMIFCRQTESRRVPVRILELGGPQGSGVLIIWDIFLQSCRAVQNFGMQLWMIWPCVEAFMSTHTMDPQRPNYRKG